MGYGDTITVSDVEINTTTDVEVSIDDITDQIDLDAMLSYYDNTNATLEWVIGQMDAEELVKEICDNDEIRQAISGAVMAEPDMFNISAKAPLVITSKDIGHGVMALSVDDKVRAVVNPHMGKWNARYIGKDDAIQCFTAETEEQAMNLINAVLNWNRS